MAVNTWNETFAGMGFFLLEEDGVDAGYCYEPQEGGCYLVATDEEGDLPKEGQTVIIACYSPADAFLWKLEFADPPALYAVCGHCKGGALLDKLTEIEKISWQMP